MFVSFVQSDLYSIGVIALELFQPFGTEMERVHTLGELGQGKIPNMLSKNWPLLAKYITLLTSTDPSMRPSASQLLQSDLFSTNDMVCVALKFFLTPKMEQMSMYIHILNTFAALKKKTVDLLTLFAFFILGYSQFETQG